MKQKRRRQGDTGIKNHIVVVKVSYNMKLIVVLETSTGHAVAESQSPVDQNEKAHCCKLPNRGAREHLPRTDDHAVAQYYVVVLEVPGVRGVVNYHKVTHITILFALDSDTCE